MVRYILINDRKPKLATHCVLCPTELKHSYVRDCGTGLHYCSHFCIEEHIAESEHAILRAAAKAVKRLEHRRAR